MQSIASLLIQYWSKIEPILSKTLNSVDFRSLVIAKRAGLNSLIDWLLTHPDIVKVIKIILGKYVGL
ncbi:hypothetical protein J2W44_005694 [Priestia aryabhattai]|uniref:hypothetical protein n=1 Tax=Priestia aryabhattai TaxID=412384 RepID=UPI0027E3C331|nr:hypothetical protein [Priestia aryabhattai]MDP9726582.1 hypothetical protein [Priestia aryabhattai]